MKTALLTGTSFLSRDPIHISLGTITHNLETRKMHFVPENDFKNWACELEYNSLVGVRDIDLPNGFGFLISPPSGFVMVTFVDDTTEVEQNFRLTNDPTEKYKELVR